MVTSRGGVEPVPVGPDPAPRLRLPARLGLREPPDYPVPPDEVNPDDHTWAYGWPAGARMAADFPHIFPEETALATSRVADLGCGLGALGFSALYAGAREVLFADGADGAVAWVAAVIAENALGNRARAMRHAWGTPLPEGPWNLIMGGDILYRPASFPALLDTIAQSLAPHGRCLLSDPRAVLEDDLPLLAQARDLTWTTERRSANYTLIRVTRPG